VPKILIADDNTNIQKMVSLAFEERGIDVVSVGNGETAVRKLPDVNPDLVLADVFMPVRNGYEVCEFVKKDTRYAHVPVILLVGAFDPLDEREARRVGADGVLKKPFVPPDPLIAMVMSALERNPKVAAELAKAKEVIREPEPPPEVLENPAQKAPTPLPDFPEPTPEEAAQIYGFGKGVRTLDETEEDSKAPPPRKPAQEEESEEEDEHLSARDWRRRGMDLDIPDDIAAKPAFSTDQDFSPVSFPSERDVPPRRVRPHELEEPVEMAKPHSESPLETRAESPVESKTEASVASSTASIQESSVVTTTSTGDERPAAETVPQEPVHKRGLRGAFSSLFGREEQPELTAVPEPTRPPEAAPVVAEQVDSRPQEEAESVSSASHWMDLMSPAPPAAYASGSWLDALSPSEAKSTAPESAEPAATVPSVTAAAEPSGGVEAMDQSDEEIHQVAPAKDPAVEQSIPFEKEEKGEEPRLFGRGLSREEFSYHLPSEKPAHEEEKSNFFAESPAEETSVTQDNPPAAAAPQTELSSFFAPAPNPFSAPDHASQPVAAPPEFAAETTVAETVSLFFSQASQEAGERIPTTPPPNREALAGIPFLRPPREITEPADVTPSAALPVDVDSVVQRVAERLGPQLQELLAQGLLKPLVENLLQQELAKKEK
jgi:CheY-like chemotaxis protein